MITLATGSPGYNLWITRQIVHRQPAPLYTRITALCTVLRKVVKPGKCFRARWQQVTNAVLDTLKLIGVDTCHYSGISMRRGGISAGLAACVPEPILFLQSGHGSNCAARNYMLPRDPHVLFETYLAFGLGL